MTSITWAGPRCVQGLAAILGPQNRTQGRCECHLGRCNGYDVLACTLMTQLMINKQSGYVGH